MTADEIKQQITMFDVLHRYGLSANRSGMTSCPFHKDKKPSMKIYKDGYKCFSCNRAGDIFGFVQEYENISFRDAFLILGGTYEQQNDRQKALNKMRFAANKNKLQKQKDTESEFYQMMVYSYGRLQRAIDEEKVFSDKWCYAQNALQIIEQIWECKFIRNEKVNEIDGIRIYRQIRCKFDSK